MSGRMQGDLDAVPVDRLAIAQAFDRNSAEPPAQNRRAILMAKIGGAAEARMIGMAVADDRPVDGAPWVDKKIAGGTKEPLRAMDDQIHGQGAVGRGGASVRSRKTSTRMRRNDIV